MKRIPKLCFHRGTGRAYVTDPVSRSEVYLGLWGTPEADQAYGEWVKSFLTPPPIQVKDPAVITVAELLVAYLEHAHVYYRKNGRLTSEVSCLKIASRAVRRE